MLAGKVLLLSGWMEAIFHLPCVFKNSPTGQTMGQVSFNHTAPGLSMLLSPFFALIFFTAQVLVLMQMSKVTGYKGIAFPGADVFATQFQNTFFPRCLEPTEPELLNLREHSKKPSGILHFAQRCTSTDDQILLPAHSKKKNVLNSDG